MVWNPQIGSSSKLKSQQNGCCYRTLVCYAFCMLCTPFRANRCCRSLVLSPGEAQSITPPTDVRITNIALGDVLADQKGRTTVKLIYLPPSAPESDEDDGEEDEEGAGEPVATVLCSLTPGKVRSRKIAWFSF